MKRNLIFLFCTLFFSAQLFGQGETYNWCFGDSAYVQFTGGAMVTQPYSNTQSIEGNASISDNNGNLLFYISGASHHAFNLRAIDKNHQVMPNGDSLYGYTSSTNGIMIVPFPGDSSKYYVFTNRYSQNPLSANFNLCKNIIDITQNGGNGDVIQKNIVISSQHVCEKMALVKHGNGKDWWFMVHDTDSSLFYTFLIDSSGMHNPLIQSIGAIYDLYSNLGGIETGHWGEMTFSNDGSKLAVVSNSIIDYFQFDRCTGILSNYLNLVVPSPINDDFYYGCSFSLNDSILYVTRLEGDVSTQSDLFQFDLSAANIMASRQTIHSLFGGITFGQLEMAPDNKLYVVTGYNGFPNYFFDSTSMYLSTIENPNNLGLACDFQLYSFYLGGHRAFLGLPNMPNYNLGALVGSPCDTITGINQLENSIINIEVFPNPFNDEITIAFPGQNLKHVNITIKNTLAQTVFEMEINSPMQKTKLDLSFLSDGIYLIDVTTEGKRFVKKIVKE